MAKLHNKTIQAALAEIIKTGRVSQAVGEPLLKQELIQVNIQDVDANGNAAAILTDKGRAGMPAPKTAEAGSATSIQLISGIVLPESKRGFGRKEGESKYPFKTMEAGVSFFVKNSEVEGGDALKKMSSTVSNANNKFRTATGENRSVTRKKKGGNGETETVNLPVYKAERKFTVRGVKAGQVLGTWTAPEDGAVIQRIL